MSDQNSVWAGLRTNVSGACHRLQQGVVSETSTTARSRSVLSKLRKAASKPPGSVPEIWEYTTALIPQDLLGNGRQPSIAETATHMAMTSFAIHQQSQTAPMHVSGKGGHANFGWSVGMLLRSDAFSHEAVLKRFSRVTAATHINQSTSSLRGLITMMRKESIPIDYGIFAVDLAMLQVPSRAPEVLLSWGRSQVITGYAPNKP